MKKFLGIVFSLLMVCPFVVWDSLKLPEIELSKYYWSITLLINMHMELGDGDQNNNSFQYYTTLLSVMDQYAELDVIWYLKQSINADDTLSYTLDVLSQLLSKASLAMSTLERSMEILNQTKLDCDTSKELSDKNFSMALNDYNYVNMQKYLDLSSSYDRCSSDARINYNVYKKIRSRISYYNDILKRKYEYFQKNRYDIAEHYFSIKE